MSAAAHRRRFRRSSSVETLECRQMLAATNINVRVRSGQTFVTWKEDTGRSGERYHVYRHNQPITGSNLNQATRLTSRWGPLDDDTSVHQLAGPGSPGRFVITDNGSPLGANTGLFVYTTQAGDSASAYYAVTQVNGSNEDRSIDRGENATTSAVTETRQTPKPILVAQQNGGRGRIYTQFMDYSRWNPTFQGYAYNYAVALPADYDASRSYPLKVVLHAYNGRYRYEPQTEFGWDAIQIFPDDPGADNGTTHTWWYGFAEDHDYRNAAVPRSGQIRNFTEERVLKAIDELIDNTDFNVDSRRIHAQGFSMGASGALSLGLRYGRVFSSIYAPAAMSDYARDTVFQSEFRRLWGDRSSQLKTLNRGTRASLLTPFNGQDVWEWQDLVRFIRLQPAHPSAHLAVFAGKNDNIINYSTQGAPLLRALSETGGKSFTAELRGGWDHNWPGFTGINDQMLSSGRSTDLGVYTFRRESTPAISRASNSGPANPGAGPTDSYNLDIDWATASNTFGELIVDQADRWEITLRSRSGSQRATVAPQRTDRFQAVPSATYNWENYNASDGSREASGTVTASADGMIRVPNFLIRSGAGSRLVLVRSSGGSQPGVEIRNRTMFVTGSGSTDNLRVTTAGGNTSVRFNGRTREYPNADFSKFLVRTGGGNDKVFISSAKRARVESGAGNDTITTGGGNDTVLGASGADIIETRAGNDSVTGGTGADRIRTSVGNDTLNGSGGNDILVGESGRDRLNGGSGRDLLIGGDGLDQLRGGNSDDILVGDKTVHDALFANLTAVLNEWKSGRSYGSRVSNIRTGGGTNGNLKLNSTTVIGDDNQTDSLFGNAGRDWFFSSGDRLFDQENDERIDNA